MVLVQPPRALANPRRRCRPSVASSPSTADDMFTSSRLMPLQKYHIFWNWDCKPAPNPPPPCFASNVSCDDILPPTIVMLVLQKQVVCARVYCKTAALPQPTQQGKEGLDKGVWTNSRVGLSNCVQLDGVASPWEGGKSHISDFGLATNLSLFFLGHYCILCCVPQKSFFLAGNEYLQGVNKTQFTPYHRGPAAWKDTWSGRSMQLVRG